MMDWGSALARCQELGMPWSHDPVPLHSDGFAMHSIGQCNRPRTLAIHLDPSEAIASRIPNSCLDCRGWTTTKFGFLLAAAVEAFNAIDLDAGGHSADTWQGLAALLHQPAWRGWPGSSYALDEMKSLAQDSDAASNRTARRSVARLDLADLHRIVAAQALIVPVAAGEGQVLHRWAEAMRVQWRGSPAVSRPDPRYDGALTAALGTPDRIVVAIHVTGAGWNPVGWPLPIEAAMIAYAAGATAGTSAVVRLNPAVAFGLDAICRFGAVEIGESDEENDAVLRTAGALLTSGTTERTVGLSLDEAVRCARIVHCGHPSDGAGPVESVAAAEALPH